MGDKEIISKLRSEDEAQIRMALNHMFKHGSSWKKIAHNACKEITLNRAFEERDVFVQAVYVLYKAVATGKFLGAENMDLQLLILKSFFSKTCFNIAMSAVKNEHKFVSGEDLFFFLESSETTDRKLLSDSQEKEKERLVRYLCDNVGGICAKILSLKFQFYENPVIAEKLDLPLKRVDDRVRYCKSKATEYLNEHPSLIAKFKNLL